MFDKIPLPVDGSGAGCCVEALPTRFRTRRGCRSSWSSDACTAGMNRLGKGER